MMQFTAVVLISARPGICWKSFYLLCSLHASFYFAWKICTEKEGDDDNFFSDNAGAQQGFIQTLELRESCSRNHFGLYNQFFRSSSEKEVTPLQVLHPAYHKKILPDTHP